MRNKRTIPLIAFDFGETLATLSPSREKLFLAAAKSIGLKPSAGKVKAAYQKLDATLRFSSLKIDTPAKRELFYSRYHRALCRLLRIPGAFTRLHPALRVVFKTKRRWVAFKDVRPALKLLKKKKVKLALFANWDKDLMKYVRQNKLTAYFDCIVPSAELGAEKPDPLFFKRALRKAGHRLQAAPAYYVGNDYTLDILPAKKAGFIPVFIDRHGLKRDAKSLRFGSLYECAKRIP